MRVAQLFGMVVVTFLVLISSVVATDCVGPGVNTSCYVNTVGVTISFGQQAQSSCGSVTDFGLQNDCVGGNSVQWVGDVNLSTLGNVSVGEVVISLTSIFVDTMLRPDLDKPAVLTFKSVPFAVEPIVERNGVECVDCNATYDQFTRDLVVAVSGFSNYSLTYRQDFTLYSDTQPELKDKVYQTIDLGNSRRGTEYSCIVQVFGLNKAGQYVLLQTNPMRDVQAKILGNPDTNQPESLGYFPTRAGIANVYFRGDIQPMAGYEDFEYVAQCSSNTTNLVYEEPISTRYPSLGRSMTGRGIWVTQDQNAFFLVIMVVLVFIGAFLSVKVVRSMFGR